MTRYAVELTDAARASIAAYARYIAVDGKAPKEAERWLEGIWDAVDSLEDWPRRCPTAEEDAYVGYDVRQLVIHSHLLLFTVDHDRRTVWVLALRHGHQRPRPADLPPDPTSLEGGTDA